MTPKVLEQSTVKAGTWADPQMHPFAVARLDRMYYVRFALDHALKIARVVSRFPMEARGGTTTDGVHGEIEPFANLYDLDHLRGKQLRLMGYPFNAHVVYRIVVEP